MHSPNKGAWLIAMLVAGCAGTGTVGASERTWHELRSARCQVFTDGDIALGQALSQDLERFHQVVMRETTAEERDTMPALRVFLLRDTDLLDAVLPVVGQRKYRGRVGGVFVPTERGNVAVIDMQSATGEGQRNTGQREIFHEYAHYIMAMAGANVPSWYNEGFAEYLSTTEFRDDGSYTVGCPPQQKVQRRGWIPLRALFESERIADLASAEAARVFPSRVRAAEPIVSNSYAQAWAIVHYFFSDPARKRQLQQYLILWQTGATFDAAVRTAFAVEPDVLEASLQRHALQSHFDCLAVKPVEALVARPARHFELAPARANTLSADLLALARGPTKEVGDLLEGTTRAAPSDPEPVLALARVRLGQAVQERANGERNPGWALTSAEQLLATARARGAAEPARLVIEGHLHAIRADLARGNAEAVEREVELARTAFRGAIRADETLAEAYWALGQTYLTHDTGSQEAVVVLEAAGYMLPMFTAIPFTLARIRVARGEGDAAIAPLQYVIRWSRNLDERMRALKLLEQIRAHAHPAAPAPALQSAPATG